MIQGLQLSFLSAPAQMDEEQRMIGLPDGKPVPKVKMVWKGLFRNV